MSEYDSKYMTRAFELAKQGLGNVSPNPMVGCVIVHNDRIIGEGWHQKYGEPHAEVNAVNSVKGQSLLSEATAYVTLEPCVHYGKTPPCADLLISHQLKKVVIANTDPFPLVNGGGIKKLEHAGIEVKIGVLEEVGREINKRFFSAIEKKRPYIILKWAQTADGFIARENFDSKWISNEYSRKLVHKWRAEEDAILVGTNTAKYDNPSLNVRGWEGNNPLRLVINKNLSLDNSLNLFDRTIPTVCYNLKKDEIAENLIFKKISKGHVIRDILFDLDERKIQSLIVEGGSSLINSFISEGLWDEARVFTAKNTFGNGIAAPKTFGKLISSESVKGDQLDIYVNK
ncbi:bifunctional diaminohydroxyphosphoribosylaminopyrimidine deaminase/5-amino-6-(5-phosphoribosylamino)uracil reductase RibD [Reichenbachiella sp. MALMAid0571]|uniref:bifunctional diaminohydroxyphosphoribosylaminopyrimidine deaminase/5-amino-6-(5-phosphoribosylamino)uracil reductase RibD n=1 Tax=Reichenbachiella sp. MALMAid0571 TaxID=3143939 RepID=UPI0032DF4107